MRNGTLSESIQNRQALTGLRIIIIIVIVITITAIVINGQL